MAVKNKLRERIKKEKKEKKEKSRKKWTKEVDSHEDNGEVENGESEEELEGDLEKAEEEVEKLKSILDSEGDVNLDNVEIKVSKPIAQLKKGDKIKVDGVEFDIDAHYVLIDHGKTKEMAIEIFNPKTDKDYQLRYFTDQMETSIEFYELQEIVYVRKPVKRVEW